MGTKRPMPDGFGAAQVRGSTVGLALLARPLEMTPSSHRGGDGAHHPFRTITATLTIDETEGVTGDEVNRNA
jgi:hypothetical protein